MNWILLPESMEKYFYTRTPQRFLKTWYQRWVILSVRVSFDIWHSVVEKLWFVKLWITFEKRNMLALVDVYCNNVAILAISFDDCVLTSEYNLIGPHTIFHMMCTLYRFQLVRLPVLILLLSAYGCNYTTDYVDLIFILDSTSLTNKETFGKIRDFSSSFISKLEIGKRNTSVRCTISLKRVLEVEQVLCHFFQGGNCHSIKWSGISLFVESVP